MRGLYSTKDTFVTTALDANVKIAWLETRTGVNYLTLRRHYGKWMPSDGGRELERFARRPDALWAGELCRTQSQLCRGLGEESEKLGTKTCEREDS